jgi:hypothetical protein
MKTIVPEVVRPSPSAKGEDEEHQKGATAANGLGLLGAGGGGGQWRTTVVDVSSHELAQEEGVMTAEQVGEDGAAGLHEQDQVPRRPKRRAKRSSATTTADEEDAVAGSLARRNYSHGTPEQDLRAFKEQLRRRLSSQPLRRNKSHGVATFKRLREAASEKKKLQQQQQEQSRRGGKIK